jgi:hypothetical protein
MGEALRLEWRDVDLTGGRAILWKTKNGRRRDVTLPPRLVALPYLDGLVIRWARQQRAVGAGLHSTSVVAAYMPRRAAAVRSRPLGRRRSAAPTSTPSCRSSKDKNSRCLALPDAAPLDSYKELFGGARSHRSRSRTPSFIINDARLTLLITEYRTKFGNMSMSDEVRVHTHLSW